MIWLVACVVPGPFVEPGDGPPVIGTPVITSLTRVCDVDAGLWTLEVEASSWTGGAASSWVEGQYVEQHLVPVISSAPEPTGESLALTLAIVSDWREQAANVSTQFTCGDAPSTVVVLFDVEGEVADCAVEGDTALLELVEGCPGQS